MPVPPPVTTAAVPLKSPGRKTERSSSAAGMWDVGIARATLRGERSQQRAERRAAARRRMAARDRGGRTRGAAATLYVRRGARSVYVATYRYRIIA
jgi:hypothetical protein